MFVVYSFGSLFTPVSVLTSIFSLIALDKVVHVLLSSWTFHIWCWKSNFADIWKLISSDITDWRDSSRQLDARLTFYFLQLLLVFRYHLLGFWNIYSMFWFSEICPLSLINSFPWYLPLIFSLWFPLLDFLCSISLAWYPLLDFLCLISLAWFPWPLYPQAFLFPFLKRSHQRPILRTNYNFARLINLFSPQIWPFPRPKKETTATIISLHWEEQIRRDKEPFPSTINFRSH